MLATSIACDGSQAFLKMYSNKMSRHSLVSVVGGVNVDISAALTTAFVHGDSIPGNVSVGMGGVARNMAHNLVVLGHDVRFVTLFGGDSFGAMCQTQCNDIGLDLSLSEQRDGLRNGLYLCVNDQTGDMIVAVADTDIINDLTPNFLSCRINPINQSEAVVADANLSVDSLRYLIDHCRAPLFVDAVSTNKALRVVEALKESDAHRLHTLKLNRQEALVATESDTVEQAAAKLAEMGVEHILVTLGAAGVLCCDGSSTLYFPSQPVDVVNTTGAGDAFLAAVVHALLRGVPFPLAAQYGQQVARATLLTKQSVNPEICNIPLPILS